MGPEVVGDAGLLHEPDEEEHQRRPGVHPRVIEPDEITDGRSPATKRDYVVLANEPAPLGERKYRGQGTRLFRFPDLGRQSPA